MHRIPLRGVACALLSATAALVPLRAPARPASTIRVNIASGAALNHFSPARALGAGIDAVSTGDVDRVYTQPNLRSMLSAGWGSLTYRLYTELGVQAWHWNPTGTWSDPVGQGYFTGSADPASPAVRHSFGYRLPHRGFTHDQANNDDYSRLTDGDPNSYWKSNPYLSHVFTGEPDSAHPQWAIVDIGTERIMNGMRIEWSNPYAFAYHVEYWKPLDPGNDDPINDPTSGAWALFPNGNITNGTGGVANLVLASLSVKTRFVRVVMTVSSETVDTHGGIDPRNAEGFAIREISVGNYVNGLFTDLLTHSPDSSQSATYVSSVDPWHQPVDQVEDEEQPGFDLVFTNGLSRGLPVTVPVSMLYGTPDDAAAEIRFLEARGIPIARVELGEEPDGQYVSPEDYGALYLQWATAIRAADPSLPLGGPVFQGTTDDVLIWKDGNGNASWLSRFINYLNSHGRMADLQFMSFEHYPFDPGGNPSKNLLQEPGLVRHVLDTWTADGLPAGVPRYVTEYNYSAAYTGATQDIRGALWNADFLGSFLAAGGAGAFYYQYEPLPLYRGNRNDWGSFSMFTVDGSDQVKSPTATFYSAQMLTQEWCQPVDATHDLYPTTSNITDNQGNNLVTAYTVQRPDGQWSVMLINKSPSQTVRTSVILSAGGSTPDREFAHPVSSTVLSPANYKWHASGNRGYPSPDGPLTHKILPGGEGALYALPPNSITVLKGTLEQ